MYSMDWRGYLIHDAPLRVRKLGSETWCDRARAWLRTQPGYRTSVLQLTDAEIDALPLQAAENLFYVLKA